MISQLEKKIALRYLNPQRKEGFLKIILIFSFLGIAIGVSVLIIVMSVMNGFRAELTNKILGFNPHIIIKPYEKPIDLSKKKEFSLFFLDKSIGFSYGLRIICGLKPNILFVNYALKPFITDITIIKTNTHMSKHKKEKIKIICKNA